MNSGVFVFVYITYTDVEWLSFNPLFVDSSYTSLTCLWVQYNMNYRSTRGLKYFHWEPIIMIFCFYGWVYRIVLYRVFLNLAGKTDNTRLLQKLYQWYCMLITVKKMCWVDQIKCRFYCTNFIFSFHLYEIGTYISL